MNEVIKQMQKRIVEGIQLPDKKQQNQLRKDSRLWRVMLEGIDAVESNALGAQEGYNRRCADLSDEYRLTAREAEILLLLGRGHTSSFVADELTVAESTVRSHRKNIYRKLGVSSRDELFKLLDDEGDGPDKGV